MLRVLIGVVIGILASASIGSAGIPLGTMSWPWGSPVTSKDYAGLPFETHATYATGVFTGLTMAQIDPGGAYPDPRYFLRCLERRGIVTSYAFRQLLDDYILRNNYNSDDASSSMTLVAGSALLELCPPR
jgi:hypothetical protein